MRILITGATGFIGQHLVNKLLDEEHELILYVRSPSKAFSLFANRCSIIEYLDDINLKRLPDVVINLAGEPIADKRWNESRKRELLESRVDYTQQLVDWLASHVPHLKVFISGSAIGYYGSHQAAVKLDEDSEPQQCFTHELCQQWEQQALAMAKLGVRVCLLRTGIVLGNGGALSKMLPAFRCGLGGPIATSEQVMSWIHIDDVIAAIIFILNNERITGAVNITAPAPVSNQTFSAELGRVLNRPVWFRVPEFVIKLMLGEGATLLIEGQQVIPQKLLDHHFKFTYPELSAALKDCCK